MNQRFVRSFNALAGAAGLAGMLTLLAACGGGGGDGDGDGDGDAPAGPPALQAQADQGQNLEENKEGKAESLSATIQALPMAPLDTSSGVAIGSSDVGPQFDTLADRSGAYINANVFAANGDAVIASLKAWVRGKSGAGIAYKAAIYAASTSTPQLLAASTVRSATASAAWLDLPLNRTVTLKKGEKYWLAIWSDNTAAGVATSAGTSVDSLRWMKRSFSSEWPQALAFTGGNQYRYSIHALKEADAPEPQPEPPNPNPNPNPNPPSTRTCPAYPALPDLRCVGVPEGYSFRQVAPTLETTASGQQIDGVRITGDLHIQHDNVTVTNSRILGRIYLNDHTGLTLQDVDLGPDQCPSNRGGLRLIVGAAGYTLVRAHLHHNNDDLLAVGGGAPVTIRDSVLHNTCFYTDDHLDAVQFYDPNGTGHLNIEHSVIDVRPVNSSDRGNAAVFWADRPGAGSTLSIKESLLAGGGYALAAYDSGVGSRVRISVERTRFARGSFYSAPCALGGYSPANHSPTVPFNGVEGLVWTDNSLDDGTPLPRCD